MRYVGPRHIVIDDKPTPVPFWEPDRSLEGQIVVIVGGGPSHADIDLDRLSGHRFFAINSACRKVRPIATKDDVLYFNDNSWNENRPELVEDWPGMVVSSNRNVKARLKDAVRRVDVCALTYTMKVPPDYAHASSGHSAACLAAVMGARRILLIGFEGKAVNGRTHGHNDYSQHDLRAYAERFVPGWGGLAPAFKRMDVEVLNCTPNSAVTAFRFADLYAALSGEV